MHNREGLTPRMIWKCLKDWRMWPLYLLGLTFLSKLSDVFEKPPLSPFDF